MTDFEKLLQSADARKNSEKHTQAEKDAFVASTCKAVADQIHSLVEGPLRKRGFSVHSPSSRITYTQSILVCKSASDFSNTISVSTGDRYSVSEAIGPRDVVFEVSVYVQRAGAKSGSTRGTTNFIRTLGHPRQLSKEELDKLLKMLAEAIVDW